MYSRFLDACSPTNNSVSGQHYIVYVDNRDRVADVLAQNGISTGVHYKPLTEHPLFKQKTPKMTSSIWGKILTLPCYYGLSNKQIKKIIRAFNEAICSKK
jgi:perosamine synthetase